MQVLDRFDVVCSLIKSLSMEEALLANASNIDRASEVPSDVGAAQAAPISNTGNR